MKNVFTTERIVSWIARALPTADQVNWINISAENVRFEWRGKEFRITCRTMLVEEMNADFVISSDEADLIEQLLKKQFAIEHNASGNFDVRVNRGSAEILDATEATERARIIEVEQQRLEDLRREAYPPLREVQQEHLRMLYEMEHGGVADISAFNLRSRRF